MSTLPLQLSVRGLNKSFTLHNQDGQNRNVIQSMSFQVAQGETVALVGPSGAGKSTILRCLYGNYLPDSGTIDIAHRDQLVDIASADSQTILKLRRYTMGWVSQFLRVIPRVRTLDVVAEPAIRIGVDAVIAIERAEELLVRLNVPTRLWHLAPATFSGGEQQRVNLARGLVGQHSLLFVDEPTASLDEVNRAVVVQLLREATARGTAIVGIFHDEFVRRSLGVRCIDVEPSVDSNTNENREGQNP
jgi:alpha-D-ribose 1-methylphosphonate 5-triphosphate synthase subunit PhnL